MSASGTQSSRPLSIALVCVFLVDNLRHSGSDCHSRGVRRHRASRELSSFRVPAGAFRRQCIRGKMSAFAERSEAGLH